MSLATTIFSLLLIVTAGVLLRLQPSPWRGEALDPEDDNEEAEDDATGGEPRGAEHRRRQAAFTRNQQRRRWQTSAMLGLIGVLMFVGQFLDRWPLLHLFHWLGVAALVVWLMLLAIGDLLLTRQHYGRIHRDDLLAELRFHAELRRQHESDSDDSSTDDSP